MSSIYDSSENSGENINQPLLRELIAKHFNLGEVAVLCFDLKVDYEDLDGENKAGKTMSLVSYFRRRNSLKKLIDKCHKERPQINWDVVIEQPESIQIPVKTNKIFVTKKLNELCHLLEESYATYISQNLQRDRLYGMLHQNHEIPNYRGFNDLFYQLRDQMRKEERELFQIIRGTTELSIFRNNERVREWIDENPLFQFLPEETPSSYKLEEDILQLKIHFNSWFPKYYNVFKNDKKESLVYLNDEFEQGIGFPKTLMQSVLNVISELASE